jgi:hypothetical protein
LAQFSLFSDDTKIQLRRLDLIKHSPRFDCWSL